jgi:monomeric sarcosine oxidase
MGTAAGWALARQGVRVAVLEQFRHIHSLGSHGGKTRIFRHAYAEGPRYVPWTLESDRLWTVLQERTGNIFMHRNGCVDISAPGYPRARDARASAEAYGIANEWLTGAEVNSRWPIFRIPEDREVCYGPEAGFLDVEVALRSLTQEFTSAGGVVHDNTPVVSWFANESGVKVESADNTYVAENLILTAGAWSGALLHDLGIPLEVRRKPVLWFEVDAAHEALAEPGRMPVFISDDEHGEFYGIPHHDVPGVKVGMHSGGEVVDPETIDRRVDERDVRPDIWPFIQRTFRGFTGNVLDTACCMYTMTPDEDFVIDRHPEIERVVFAAGFSGHGFKFTPVIGEYLARLATTADEPIGDFSVRRFPSAD